MSRVVGFFFNFLDDVDGGCFFEDDCTEDDLEESNGRGVGGGDGGLGTLGHLYIGEVGGGVDGIGEVAENNGGIDEGNDGKTEEEMFSKR